MKDLAIEQDKDLETGLFFVKINAKALIYNDLAFYDKFFIYYVV